jgi:hypothetical protein
MDILHAEAFSLQKRENGQKSLTNQSFSDGAN